MHIHYFKTRAVRPIAKGGGVGVVGKPMANTYSRNSTLYRATMLFDLAKYLGHT